MDYPPSGQNIGAGDTLIPRGFTPMHEGYLLNVGIPMSPGASLGGWSVGDKSKMALSVP